MAFGTKVLSRAMCSPNIALHKTVIIHVASYKLYSII